MFEVLDGVFVHARLVVEVVHLFLPLGFRIFLPFRMFFTKELTFRTAPLDGLKLFVDELLVDFPGRASEGVAVEGKFELFYCRTNLFSNALKRETHTKGTRGLSTVVAS